MTTTDAGSAQSRRAIAADHPAFAGHFPGTPLLPGVALLAEVLEAARAHPEPARRLAAGVALETAKFLAPVRPDAELALALDWDDAGLRFEIRTGEGAIAAKGRWRWLPEAASS
jgi:3-hydroxymyristoyl/3-hydroxydecanoyl-(acyl carrier protein) dehydratase